MARTTRPRQLQRRLPIAAVLDALSVSENTYRRHWQAVFTDLRKSGTPGQGSPRLVYEDELAVAVDSGKPGAVLAFRKLMGRYP